MFNLQGSEIVIVLLLALVVLGPEKLPDAIRKVGQFYAELKKMSSGFQSEFRAAVDEPMREMRDTASLLRDSADFTKLQDGERDEKPRSAEMGDVEPGGDSEPAPVARPESLTGAAVDGTPDEPRLAPDSKPAPFSGQSSASPRTDEAPSGPISEPVAGDEPVSTADSKPAPFSGQSSAAPRPAPVEPIGEGEGVVAGEDDADGRTTTVDHADESTAGARPSSADDASGQAR